MSFAKNLKSRVVQPALAAERSLMRWLIVIKVIRMAAICDAEVKVKQSVDVVIPNLV